MAWLLDTNILSEIRRLRPEPKVLAFISGNPLEEMYISAVTLAELRALQGEAERHFSRAYLRSPQPGAAA